jgi:serine/threonine protein kinase
MQLTGKITQGGWRIGEQVTFPPEHTGGNFSNCYLVSKGGETAFLKALDIERFDVSELLWNLSGFQYESELADHCASAGLSRVTRLIEAGKIERDPALPPALRNVPFLVFERAQRGDIRPSVDVSKNVTNQWRFFVLHQAATGLMQLHGESIAHQDLKPSNLFVFSSSKVKIGDLGRASMKGKQAPHDELAEPGARNYSPFEQRYGMSAVSADWVERRFSADVFHLGCLTVFVFTNICFPQYVMSKLAPAYQPLNWGAAYSEVVPHIQACVSEAVVEISAGFPERFRSDLVALVVDLCDPDPNIRGRKQRASSNPTGARWLERTVSRLNSLEKAARVREVGKHA